MIPLSVIILPSILRIGIMDRRGGDCKLNGQN
jgi:hypothetical protein